MAERTKKSPEVARLPGIIFWTTLFSLPSPLRGEGEGEGEEF